MILTDRIVVLWSYGYRCFDRGVWVVIVEVDVLKFEVEDVFDLGVQGDGWRGEDCAVALGEVGIDVVAVDMRVTKAVDEPPRTVAGNLRDHHQKQAVARYVERHAEEDVGAALVKLEVHLAILVDVDLPEAMARRECHALDFAWIPRGDNVTPTKWVFLDSFDQVYDLVFGLPSIIHTVPVTPLFRVYRAEIAVTISPFVPYRDAMLL